jgi:hypothetical protein
VKKLVTIREALSDATLLADALPGESWTGWILLIAAMGEPLSEAERAIFTFTGREAEPGVMVETSLTVAGRRSGKSRAMAVLCVYLACLCDWSEDLAIGDSLCVGGHRSFASAVRARDRADAGHTVALSRGVDLEVQCASWRRSRGGTAVAIVLDECAFVHNADDAANSDAEIIVALRPSLATGGPMLLTSSPSTMEGVRPPFDPDDATASAAALLNMWGVSQVIGDAYAAAWPISAFADYLRSRVADQIGNLFARPSAVHGATC